MYRGHATPEDICKEYARELKHRYNDAWDKVVKITRKNLLNHSKFR
jgi:hypothetical protein